MVIFEIQQNSDTTYRVFDWNRVGLDGKPRELHVAQSLASIDFNDFEPALQVARSISTAPGWERLVSDPLFVVDSFKANAATNLSLEGRRMQILAVVTGNVVVGDCAAPVTLAAGRFCLIPASLENVQCETTAGTRLLKVQGEW